LFNEQSLAFIIVASGSGDLSAFMHWITTTHTVRYHLAYGTTGSGHISQGCFKIFPVQRNNYYLTLLKYIEANPVKASMVKDAAQWPWSSYLLHIGAITNSPIEIYKSPITLPTDWHIMIHKNISRTKTELIATAIKRGRPLGDPKWVTKTTKALCIESSLSPRGRPRKDGS
jgi:putative transposase